MTEGYLLELVQCALSNANTQNYLTSNLLKQAQRIAIHHRFIKSLRWVHWWNTKRVHGALDYATPQEVETEYYLTQPINTGP